MSKGIEGRDGMMRISKFMTGIALGAILTGCATAPPQVVRDDELPATYSAPQTGASGTPVFGDWWKGFNVPELAAFIREAHDGNLDLAQAAARVVEAQAQTGLAAASLLPTVTLTGSAARNGSRVDTQNMVALNGAASYELDFWGQNINTLRAARQAARGALFSRQTVRLTTEADVANTYFSILALRERIAIARENVAASRRILAITQAKSTIGVLSNLELAQQTAQVLGTESTIPGLEEQEREQLNALAVLLGRMPGKVAVENRRLGGLSIPALQPGLPLLVLTRRPDVALAEANLLAAHANLDAARAAFLPGASLSASGGWSKAALDGLIDPGNLAWSLGASFVETIFDGGQRTSTRDYYRAMETELVAKYRAVVLSALSDTEAQLGSLVSSGEQERLVADQATQAEEAFRISEAQYREGVADLLTVLEAQQTMLSAQDNLVQTKLTRLQAGVGLYRALGGGWSVQDEANTGLRNAFVPVPDITDLPVGLRL
jgi:outer membrane protein, multidrug efflux system